MLSKIKQLKFLSSISLFLLILTPASALAAKSCEQGNAKACLEEGATSSVMSIIILGINFLAAAVGLIAVIMLIIAGIQYTTSNGNPQAVQAAKTKIINILIGLISFFLLYAFMQWLIPGGFL
jgi:Type IV secretion system pilin